MNIRTILLAIALSPMLVAQAVDLPGLPSREGADVKGYVHDGTKGIAGVLVSDGYSFARTDDNGAYYLTSDKSALEVFVILPSGYGYAEVNGGVAQFFRHIDRTSAEFRADFALTAIGDDTSFSFLTHADTQPEQYFNSQVYADMAKAYKDMQAQSDVLTAAEGFAPFNLHLGDIIYNGANQPYDYDSYFGTLEQAKYNVATLTTPGNHDRWYRTDYTVAMERYRKAWGPVYYSFNRGKVHFISVDNVLVKKDDDYTRGISEAAVEWMKKDLSYVEKGSRVVFFTHQPMTRNTAALKAYSGVLDMLKEYDVLILTGHLHRIFNNFPEYAPTIKERNHVALGGYEWRGPCSQDGVPNGYYIYHVDGTDISWKYKWTGKDADKNMFRLYEPGQFGTPVYAPSEDKTIIVNVWDWDEDWKVTWSLDGVDMGAAERQDEAEDPWAIYSFANDPAHPTWVAKPTYHIFHCNVPASGSVVKVTVADPFGRELSKTITLESDPSGGIEAIAPESCGVLAVEIYNMQGIKVLTVDGYPEADTLPLEHGCYIMRLHHTDGSLSTEKITR